MVSIDQTPTSSSSIAEVSPRAGEVGRGLPTPLQIVLGLIAPAGLLIHNLIAASPLTIDDSYISFRYARNFAHGLGLVYNPGERIEGYTNFLWTVLLALGIKLHIDPHITAKLLGGLSAVGSLGVAYWLSSRLEPVRWVPVLATWLLASSMVFAGYAVLGLETQFFVFLVLAGLLLIVRENESPAQFPISGLVYGLAGLTRPEAPLFLGIAILCLGKRMISRQNYFRLGIFVGFVGIHVLWRHHYYGAWLPNTFSAKTGDLQSQLARGEGYVLNYLRGLGAWIWFGAFGAMLALFRRRSLGLAIALTAAAVAGYVILVGGDWMPVYRFMAPFEPFAFLLVDQGLRVVFNQGGGAAVATLLLFLGMDARPRLNLMEQQTRDLLNEKEAWARTSTALADWFLKDGRPGTIAMGDIGYVGWKTNYPILDILGLVDPVIAKLPGGYTTKQGPKYLDYFFSRMPDYFILISGAGDCEHPFHPAIQAIYEDPQGRFRSNYSVAHQIGLGDGNSWCVYRHQPSPRLLNRRPLFDFESGLEGWTPSGTAFLSGAARIGAANAPKVVGGGGQKVLTSFHPTLGDAATGVATSPAFTIDRKFAGIKLAGGARSSTRVELLVDGEPRFQATGANSDVLNRVIFNVQEYRGRSAQFRVIDEETSKWGHIAVDDAELFDGIEQ